MNLSKLNFKWVVFSLLIFIFNDLLFLKKIVIAEGIKYENNIPNYKRNKPLKNSLLGLYISNGLKNSKSPFISLIVSNTINANGETSSKNIESNNKLVNSLDIESETQYEKDNIFYAEGNVILYLSNGKLLADKVSYDRDNKLFKANGNLKFYKGKQFFEATDLLYNLKEEEGFIKNIYGILNIETLNEDFELKNVKDISKDFSDEFDEVDQFVYINTSSLGIVNNFENMRIGQLRPKNFFIEVPSFSKLRFKSKRLNLKSKSINSELVLFTNDPLNQPQFILESRDFTAEIVKEKTKLISNNTWLVFDKKFKFPIGKKDIVDREPSSSWGIGSDFSEKDGWYLFRGYEKKGIGSNSFIKLKPYILLQRALEGSSNSFTRDGGSIFSPKIKKDIDVSDFFALDFDMQSKIKNWKLKSKGSLNSLNPNRLNESLRNKISMQRTINLKSKDMNENIFLSKSDLEDKRIEEINNNSINLLNQSINDNNNSKSFESFLDLQIYNTFREKVSRGYYSGEAEIYFGNGLTISNRKLWNHGNSNTRVTFTYDIGHFNAKKKNVNQLTELFRNTFAFQYGNKLNIWRKEKSNKRDPKEFRYTPKIIVPQLNWDTNIQGGYFSYSNGLTQKAIGASIGPELILGNKVKNLFDFTYINLKTSLLVKEGESPFAFDDINSNNRFNFDLKQQLYGPVIFGYSSSLNMQSGKYEKPKYSLDINRRAYSIGAFYNVSTKSAGIQFNIFNFAYDGNSSKF